MAWPGLAWPGLKRNTGNGRWPSREAALPSVRNRLSAVGSVAIVIDGSLLVVTSGPVRRCQVGK